MTSRPNPRSADIARARQKALLYTDECWSDQEFFRLLEELGGPAPGRHISRREELLEGLVNETKAPLSLGDLISLMEVIRGGEAEGRCRSGLAFLCDPFPVRMEMLRNDPAARAELETRWLFLVDAIERQREHAAATAAKNRRVLRLLRVACLRMAIATATVGAASTKVAA